MFNLYFDGDLVSSYRSVCALARLRSLRRVGGRRLIIAQFSRIACHIYASNNRGFLRSHRGGRIA